MRRVSSRQRLFEWDEFEANEIYVSDEGSHTYGNDDDDTEADGYETAHSTSSPGYHDGIVVTASEDSEFAVNPSPGLDRKRTTILDDHNTAATITHTEASNVSRRKRDLSALTKKYHRPRKVESTTSRDNRGKASHSSSVMDRQDPPAVISTMKKCESSTSISAAFTKSTSTTSFSSYVTAVPTLIPGYSWELSQSMTASSSASSSSSSSNPPTFDTLMNDIYIDILEFCDLATLRAMMSINRKFRQLVRSDDSQSVIWLRHCQNRWKNSLKNGCSVLPVLVDQFHLPTAVTSTEMTHGTGKGSVNFALLLTMTPERLPSGVDESLLNVQQSRRNWRVEQQAAQRQNQALDGTTASRDFIQYNDIATGLPVVRYTGPIGAGDRCIRSDFPLPRPHFIKRSTNIPGSSLHVGGPFGDKKGSGTGNFLKFLRRGAHRMTGGGSSRSTFTRSTSDPTAEALQWRPFVCPFVQSQPPARPSPPSLSSSPSSSSPSSTPTLNVSPRLVSYFEVSILENPPDSDGNEGDRATGLTRTHDGGLQMRHSSDCVAVGLATDSFHVHSRMPGWDRRSFGYHGDDSGLFHSSGTMVRRFGQRFGAGDTVGCGIDFVSKSIFFTLNGTFLGNGWTDIDIEFLTNDLFPVVGVDSNCPIHLNLGGEIPFAFNLGSFLMKDEKVIASNYCWTEDSAPSSMRRGQISPSFSSCTQSIGAPAKSRGRIFSSSPLRRRPSLGRMP